MDFLLIALLTLINGLFAMSELALASSRKARLAAMEEAGDKGAASALKLLENPHSVLVHSTGGHHLNWCSEWHCG